MNPIKAIAKHCLECSGGSRENRRECPSSTCALFPFREGRNPFRKPASEKQRQQARSLAIKMNARADADRG